MGEYANSKQDILDVMQEIKKGLGEVNSSLSLATKECVVTFFSVTFWIV